MAEFNHVVQKDGDVNPGQVENAIQNMGEGRKDKILSDFEEFKSYLHKRIEMADSMGMGEEQMAKIAEKVGNYLSAHEEPRNAEENLLQQLWKVGNQEERHMLAHMLVRMAQNTTTN
ncbi:DUF3243 domain-containing protein [Cohnella pontilimi]|uniref:DUF3243 domain-containing protein n=1 Tax=Cohnella pontilimi TaxID=2564100 RepID=A0A4U0FAR7_9BACL|nr:DUF3243 domain-containing protein [Cohnella pontilimi]TJY41837.1 DUF3243 domain-containing protein [Cohnella pontilimi]